jgi:hypothetical protein
VVSHLPGVKEAVRMQARGMASEAWLTLLFHRRTGQAHIEVIVPPVTETDSHVVLRDRPDPGGEGKAGPNKHKRSAMSIEMGWTAKNGRHVEGLHILDGVMKRAIAKYVGPR